MSPDPYSITFLPAAEKELGRLLSNTRMRAGRRIGRLADDPRPSGVEPISGRPGYYRVRVGDYRIVYIVDDAPRMVTIVIVRHRNDVYDRMERRLS